MFSVKIVKSEKKVSRNEETIISFLSRFNFMCVFISNVCQWVLLSFVRVCGRTMVVLNLDKANSKQSRPKRGELKIWFLDIFCFQFCFWCDRPKLFVFEKRILHLAFQSARFVIYWKAGLLTVFFFVSQLLSDFDFLVENIR